MINANNVAVNCYTYNKGDIHMDKSTRILILFYEFMKGKDVNKNDFIKRFNVNERSFERDIKIIRNFLMELHISSEILFDRKENKYYLSNWSNEKFSSTEVMVLLKLLLGTRALNKTEMETVVSSIKMMLSPIEKKELLYAIYNEMENYIAPVHNKPLLESINYINSLICQRNKIEISYRKANKQVIKRQIVPISFIFSEFYFYLIAFIDNTSYDYPAFFRIDRIIDIKNTNKKYEENIYKKYNTGSMKNCLQFMYAGKLLNAKIRCKNDAVEAMQDRMPNNWLIKDEGEYKIYKVKVFGEGFIRWALSQGDSIEILEPITIREKLKKHIECLNILYK